VERRGRKRPHLQSNRMLRNQTAAITGPNDYR